MLSEKVIPKKEKSTIVPINTSLINALSPMAIRLLDDNTLLVGDSYKKVMVITGYPAERNDAAWLDGILLLPYCIVSIDCSPANKEKLIKAADREGRIIDFLAGVKYATTSEKMSWDESQKNAEKAIQVLSYEREEIYNTTITIIISAPDLDELRRREKIVKQKLKTKRLEGRSITCNQMPAYFAASPFYCKDPTVTAQAARPMPLLTVASIMPFRIPGIDDGKGCDIGYDEHANKCRIDMLEQERIHGRSNSNYVIMGAQGTGKSTLVHKILDHACVIKKADIVVFDPEREFNEHLEKLGGHWIDIGHRGLSPFTLRYGAGDTQEGIDGADGTDFIRPVTETIRHLRVLLSIAVDLTPTDLSYIECELEEQYKRFDLKRDMTIEKCKQVMRKRKSEGKKIHPEPKDLYEGLKRQVEKEKKEGNNQTAKIYDDLAMKIYTISVGSYSDMWAGQTDMDMLASYDVVGYETTSMTRYDPRMRAAQYFNYLSFEWTKLQDAHLSGVRKPKLIHLGEAHYIINKQIPQAGYLVNQIAIGIRKRGGSLGIDTHFPDNLLADTVADTGRAIIDGSTFKYLFGLSAESLKKLSGLFDLNAEIVNELAKQTRGKCLVIAGAQSAMVNVKLSEEEKRFYGGGGGK